MPDETRRGESDLVAAVLDAPADVHVVASFSKDWVKSADFIEDPFIENHVAAGNMFGLGVGQHDMGRTSWRDCHGGGHGRILGRQEVVSADRDKIAS